MESVRGTKALDRTLVRPVLTIGNFDGLHLGHRSIMRIVIERARALDGEAVVYTFDPHPRKVLQPDKAPPLLTSLDQKLELLDEMGVDVVIVESFDADFAQLPPETFVREYIHQRIGPREVYVGYDFHFGKDREGSMRMLTETGPRLGFAVTIIPEVTVGGRDVNSSHIRDLVASGAVQEAGALLGRPFTMRGRIGRGARRGRTLGFPTANLVAETEVIPRSGVYAGRLRFLDEGEPARGSIWPVVSNVGTRPTFQDGQGLVAEAHLIDFEGDCYDRQVELGFEHLLRAEERFPDVDALRAQIARDLDEARRCLKTSV